MLKSLILLSLVIILIQSSCSWVTWREFNQIDGKEQFTIFDRYYLEILGNAHNEGDTCTFICEVDFINKIVDTTYYDTIPIFVIDSFCFEGDCLDFNYCQIIPENYDINTYMMEKGGVPIYEKKQPDDLYYSRYGLNPSNYRRLPIMLISSRCTGNIVTITIHARLIDRVTGKNIIKESKKVKFKLKKRTRPIILS